MKTRRYTGHLLTAVLLVGVMILLLYISLSYISFKYEDCRLVFPLADISDDGADYALFRYGPDALYVIDDTEYLLANKYAVFIIYPSWLENSTGDGYFQVYRNGECIFSMGYIEGDYFDILLEKHYEVYTPEEYVNNAA